MKVCVSVVSHNHGEMAFNLVKYLVSLPSIDKVILTININESIPLFYSAKLRLVVNNKPKGFGANHNSAFNISRSDFFCVINPDVIISSDIFIKLLEKFHDPSIGLVGPLVFNSQGIEEDSLRCFLTPFGIVKRIFKANSVMYKINNNDNDVTPDWISGLFMLFPSRVFQHVGGFDEDYYMYCEDADICTRLWKKGYKVLGCPSVSIIHNAQRASHKNLRHFYWHLKSLLLYFLKHSFRLPKKQIT
ncbi:glycosyltransferase [Ferrovum sp. PN-J185]|uniref:glycosyltransferase n=1 Tax=Ferrovum sp. PN-J185 TaxID=1356306 RepID=UPI000791C7A1|nr:glycosyltransferase family 2 protein [Ferrovum sp. PN-J185]KXW55828.1 rhamnosyltransferase WbbL [Ferrovum sp. PN-J185]